MWAWAGGRDGKDGGAQEEGVEDKHIVRSGNGGMDGEKAKGGGRVIICRSSTSPVNPRSRLTWLIKEAIKGPPPEILRQRRRGESEGHGPERCEPSLMGRRQENAAKEECCDLCYLLNMSNFPLGLADELPPHHRLSFTTTSSLPFLCPRILASVRSLHSDHLPPDSFLHGSWDFNKEDVLLVRLASLLYGAFSARPRTSASLMSRKRCLAVTKESSCSEKQQKKMGVKELHRLWTFWHWKINKLSLLKFHNSA